MANVFSLSGPISLDQLGIVSLSESLLFGLPGWWYAPDVDYDRAAAFKRIRSCLEQFREAGGKTIVDTTGITLGRDVKFYQRLGEVTGVQILAATGFGNQPESIPGHFYSHAFLYSNVAGPYYWYRDVPGSFYPSYGATKEYLMFLFYNELVRGMIAPGMIRTRLRAGMVKTASSWNEVTPVEELSIRGAAMAARRTGVVLYIAGSINQASRIMQIATEEGLGPDRMIIGNCDDGRKIDLARDIEFARKGAYVAYDHVGWEDPSVPFGLPDERRVDLVEGMVEAGLAANVVLSCNAIGHAIGMPQSKQTFAHLLNHFVPRLKTAGVPSRAIDTILTENPRRILSNRLEEITQTVPPYLGGPPTKMY